MTLASPRQRDQPAEWSGTDAPGEADRVAADFVSRLADRTTAANATAANTTVTNATAANAAAAHTTVTRNPTAARTTHVGPITDRSTAEHPSSVRSAADHTQADRMQAQRVQADHATAERFRCPTTFGAGGSEPYAQALQGADNVLYLHGHHPDADPGTPAQVSTMQAGRWSADADAIDRSLLAGVGGPVLDIGCGPGRMIQAAIDEGLDALGVDVSPTAVRIALAAGLAVLEGSVFDTIPQEGSWATLLLVDGNIGIGGDPDALLDRCAALLSADGILVVEAHRDPEHDLVYVGTLHDSAGNASDAFPWAEIGVSALRRRAAKVGLVPVAEWTTGGRSFVRLARA